MVAEGPENHDATAIGGTLDVVHDVPVVPVHPNARSRRDRFHRKPRGNPESEPFRTANCSQQQGIGAPILSSVAADGVAATRFGH